METKSEIRIQTLRLSERHVQKWACFFVRKGLGMVLILDPAFMIRSRQIRICAFVVTRRASL